MLEEMFCTLTHWIVKQWNLLLQVYTGTKYSSKEEIGITWIKISRAKEIKKKKKRLTSCFRIKPIPRPCWLGWLQTTTHLPSVRFLIHLFISHRAAHCQPVDWFRVPSYLYVAYLFITHLLQNHWHHRKSLMKENLFILLLKESRS